MEVKPEILVYLEPHQRNLPLLQAARNQAEKEGMQWAVITVESPHYKHTQRTHEHLLRVVETAKSMGAAIIQLEANNPADALLGYVDDRQAKQEEIKYVFIGQSHQRTGRFFSGAALGKELEKRLPSTATLSIINVSSAKELQRLNIRELLYFDITGLVFALGYVGFAVLLSTSFLLLDSKEAEYYPSIYYLDLIFLTAVAIVAVRHGLIPALFAAAISFFIVEYAIMQRQNPESIWGAEEAKNLTIFIVSSALIAVAAGYSRQFLMHQKQRQKRNEALLAVSEIITEYKSMDRMLYELVDKLEADLNMKVAVFLKDNGDIVHYQDSLEFDEEDRAALKFSLEQQLPVGIGTLKRLSSKCRFEPLLSVTRHHGVIVFKKQAGIKLDPGFGRFSAALADIIATGIENKKLSDETEQARIREEREKLRTMLLSSVSHDLKTPLVSIIGGLSTYHQMYDILSDEHKLSLTQTALDEAERLENFITNILDMTRLESGAVNIKQDWHQIDNIIRRVVKRMQSRLRQHTVNVDMPEMPVEFFCDELLFEQTLQNLLDNAAKYTPLGSDIFITLNKLDGHYRLEIRDTGPGVPEEKFESIFDKYERLKSSDGTVAGTGLGLSICKAIMEAHGGDITVRNHPEGGAVFSIYIPKQRQIQINYAA